MLAFIKAHADLLMPIWVVVFALICASISSGLAALSKKFKMPLVAKGLLLSSKVFHILALQPAPHTGAQAAKEVEAAIKEATDG